MTEPKIGQKVRLKGTHNVGEIVSIFLGYSPDFKKGRKTTFVQVMYPDGKVMEYTPDELKQAD